MSRYLLWKSHLSFFFGTSAFTKNCRKDGGKSQLSHMLLAQADKQSLHGLFMDRSVLMFYHLYQMHCLLRFYLFCQHCNSTWSVCWIVLVWLWLTCSLDLTRPGCTILQHPSSVLQQALMETCLTQRYMCRKMILTLKSCFLFFFIFRAALVHSISLAAVSRSLLLFIIFSPSVCVFLSITAAQEVA